MLPSIISAGGSASGPSTSVLQLAGYNDTQLMLRNVRAMQSLPENILPKEFEKKHVNRVTFWDKIPTADLEDIPFRNPLRHKERMRKLKQKGKNQPLPGLSAAVSEAEQEDYRFLKAELTSTCIRIVNQFQNAPSVGFDSISSSVGTFSNNSVRRGAMFCRNGQWLEVFSEKDLLQRHQYSRRPQIQMVRGNSNKFTDFGILNFISIAFGLVSIRGEKSNRYLCMGPDSRLYATSAEKYSADCVFVEQMLENYYNAYSSCSHIALEGKNKHYRPWYIGLHTSGRPRLGKRLKSQSKAAHFVVVQLDLASANATNSSSLLHESLQASIVESQRYSKIYQKVIDKKLTVLHAPAQRRPYPRTFIPDEPLYFNKVQKKPVGREQRLRVERLRRQRRIGELRELREMEVEEKRRRQYEKIQKMISKDSTPLREVHFDSSKKNPYEKYYTPYKN